MDILRIKTIVSTVLAIYIIFLGVEWIITFIIGIVCDHLGCKKEAELIEKMTNIISVTFVSIIPFILCFIFYLFGTFLHL